MSADSGDGRGWRGSSFLFFFRMQVALKYMPVQSKIVGVDLVPIAPIPGTVSFPGDITSAETRKELNRILQKQKVDVVLHDGAPNMGTNWDYDAYQQNELTLKALKLATEFLRKNGTFVTKIFRSKDYNSLQFVMQKLFRKVTATKPNASRNESAEIFVVCQDYLAPHSIDDKLLDPRYIFKEVEKEAVPATVRSFDPKKRPKKNRDGYNSTSDVLLFEKRSVSDFLVAQDPITFMYEINMLYWDEDARAKYYDKTSQTIREYMEDLKLITSKEAKEMLKWRSEMRGLNLVPREKAERKAASAAAAQGAVVEEIEVAKDPEEELQAMLENLGRKERKALKKKRELTKKRQLKVTRGIIQEGDEWDFDRDEELFDLEAAMGAELGHEMPEMPDEEEAARSSKKGSREEELTFQEMVENYLDVSHKKSKRQKVRIKGKLVAVVDEQEDEAEYEQARKLKRARQLGDGGSADWFSQELFAGVDPDLQDEEEAVVDFEETSNGQDNMEQEEEQQEKEEEEEEEEDDEREMLGKEGAVVDMDGESNDGRLKMLRMGRALVSGETNVKEMVDDSFNRWSGASTAQQEGLPEWFVEKEREYWKPFEPDREEYDARDVARVQGIADRPIKKVVEAKARRKRKIEGHMKRVEPKVMAIANNSEMGQSERVKAISKLYKGVRPKERGRVYVISNKKEQLSKKRVVKGKKRGAVRMVDKRLKRDKKKSTKRAEGAYGGGPKKHKKKG